MGLYWRRVFSDSWKLAGAMPSIVSYLVVPLMVMALTVQAAGSTEGLKDIRTYGFAVVSFLAVAFCQFVWTMAVVPFRIQRDRAAAAETRLSALESGAQLPNAVLKSLSESQAKSEALDQQLMAIAMLMEQYRRLLSATRRWADFQGSDLREDDLALVSNFLAEQTSAMLPALPFRPDQPLIFQIGWNHYRYILSVPMARVPDVSFPELPPEVSATVTKATRIYIDVQFWHSPSHNREHVDPSGPFFNARLEGGTGKAPQVRRSAGKPAGMDQARRHVSGVKVLVARVRESCPAPHSGPPCRSQPSLPATDSGPKPPSAAPRTPSWGRENGSRNPRPADAGHTRVARV